VIYVNPTLPARTLAELVAFAKANPGKITMPRAGMARRTLPASF